jgi:hypothetical protein
MDLRNFFAELKRRNTSPLFEIASVLGACQSRCPLHPKRESRHHVNG